jgi:hypothetical protein
LPVAGIKLPGREAGHSPPCNIVANASNYDRLCGLVGRGPGFDSRRYQIFCEVGLEWGPLSLVRITEALLESKRGGSGLEN